MIFSSASDSEGPKSKRAYLGFAYSNALIATHNLLSINLLYCVLCTVLIWRGCSNGFKTGAHRNLESDPETAERVDPNRGLPMDPYY